MDGQAELVRVLVVDDEPSIVDVISMALRHHGFGVEVATTGKEALDLTRRWLAGWEGGTWELYVRGLACCRAGRYADAVPLLRQAATAKDGPNVRTLGELGLVLALARLDQTEEARKQLEKTERRLADSARGPQARPDEPPAGWNWYHWQVAQCLRREARELLGVATGASDG